MPGKATVLLRDATLWTQDEHFRGLPGVRYFAKGKWQVGEIGAAMRRHRRIRSHCSPGVGSAKRAAS
jgi:hypothetical protein